MEMDKDKEMEMIDKEKYRMESKMKETKDIGHKIRLISGLFE